ncbi:tetratricopeptide repeat protein [Chitinimonas sp.]|uniref:tetratricopeptide repeat protein n=1 Tax=Chitinimonas sp. TaxID=1934313 RepID=UPI0035B1999A
MPQRIPTSPFLFAGLIALALAACAPVDSHMPTSAEIESTGLLAGPGRQADAEARLLRWAERGDAVAMRELALVYLARPAQQSEAMRWLQRGAEAGDDEAAFQLAEQLRVPAHGRQADLPRAWQWYRYAAEHQHAKAALALARMARNGDGVVRDLKLAAQWLQFASDHGNAQAMFLLSNAYLAGEGVPRNPLMARHLLERSAERDYPVAIQALALAVQGGDLLIPKDEVRAGHLLKEASEERRNRWNSYN